MIKSIRHRGLKRLYTRGDRSGINANLVNKVERILAHLDAAESIEHMRLPGYRLHEFRGHLRIFYSVSVSGNWRIIFKVRPAKLTWLITIKQSA